MTPVSHTVFTLALFLALSTLKLWNDRRHHRLVAAIRAGTPPQSAQ